MDWSIAAQAADSLLGGIIGLGTTGMNNAAQKEIAYQNLGYQQIRNAIEDQRYEEETAYNRAFAEDERNYSRAFAENERDYQRALQQQIFAREDTALERQASQLSKLGINPLSQQMNGLGAGQAVSASAAPTAAAAPSASSRGGQALHNDYSPDILNAISPVMSMIDTINGLKTGVYNRDLLRKQVDSVNLDNQTKALENLIIASKHGIKIESDGSLSMPDFKHTEQDFSDVDYEDKSASRNRNVREDVFQNEYKTHDNSPKEEQVLTALENQMENNNFVTRGMKAGLDVYNTVRHPLRAAQTMLLLSAGKKLKEIGKGAKSKFRNFLDKVNNFGDKYLETNY